MIKLMTVLQEPPNPQDAELFKRLFTQFLKAEIVDEAKIADELLVSKPTVKRWAQGKSLPRQRVRAAIYRWMLDKVHPCRQS